MHEYSIAYDLYTTARKAALEHNAILITRVSVGIGEMAMASQDQLQFLFEVIVADDPLFAGTKLECTSIPRATRCVCGYAGDEIYVCPSCGALPELVSGREILVTNVEIEVAET
ncbi:MAG: hydrogenase maturation nickel metallochaperone HypA [Methanoregulaceae archaeon]|nr:hydrogenase maturation nickel metallochaperone HypA [Methanoregulaceae archaeon]